MQCIFLFLHRKTLKRKNKGISLGKLYIISFIKSKKIRGGYEFVDQLYDLAKDPGEMNNIAEQNPALVKQFKARTKAIVDGKY